jgi:hypothetical protein
MRGFQEQQKLQSAQSVSLPTGTKKEKRREYYLKNKERERENYKKWSEKNKELKKKLRREWYLSHKEYEKEKTMSWIKNNPKRWREINSKACQMFYFGRMREEILKRDGNACRKCGSTENLNIHHIDGLGKTTPKALKNNSADNLLTLCETCHISHHHKGKPKKRGKNV